MNKIKYIIYFLNLYDVNCKIYTLITNDLTICYL